MSEAERRKAFRAVFQQLRRVLKKFEAKLSVQADKPGDYYLNSRMLWRKKKPLFFGAVRMGKSYVSYHLIPVYAFPELLHGASAELKKHMQGKSCFNFTRVEPKLFRELARLTGAGYRRFKKEGWT